jgi:hypothetical protein
MPIIDLTWCAASAASAGIAAAAPGQGLDLDAHAVQGAVALSTSW